MKQITNEQKVMIEQRIKDLKRRQTGRVISTIGLIFLIIVLCWTIIFPIFFIICLFVMARTEQHEKKEIFDLELKLRGE
jgi:hypothetical protein